MSDHGDRLRVPTTEEFISKQVVLHNFPIQRWADLNFSIREDLHGEPDVLIKCGNRQWNLNKDLLSRVSDYFKACFSGNFKVSVIVTQYPSI